MIHVRVRPDATPEPTPEPSLTPASRHRGACSTIYLGLSFSVVVADTFNGASKYSTVKLRILKILVIPRRADRRAMSGIGRLGFAVWSVWGGALLTHVVRGDVPKVFGSHRGGSVSSTSYCSSARVGSLSSSFPAGSSFAFISLLVLHFLRCPYGYHTSDRRAL